MGTCRHADQAEKRLTVIKGNMMAEKMDKSYFEEKKELALEGLVDASETASEVSGLLSSWSYDVPNIIDAAQVHEYIEVAKSKLDNVRRNFEKVRWASTATVADFDDWLRLNGHADLIFGQTTKRTAGGLLQALYELGMRIQGETLLKEQLESVENWRSKLVDIARAGRASGVVFFFGQGDVRALEGMLRISEMLELYEFSMEQRHVVLVSTQVASSG